MDTLRQFYNWLIEKVLQCCGNSEDETLDDIGERTHLLRADSANRPGSVNNFYNRNRPEQLHGQIITTGAHQGQNDEHSSLNKILNTTATKIIDIGLLGQTPGILEQHDVTESSALYQRKLINNGARIAAKHKQNVIAYEDVTNNQVQMLMEESDSVDKILISEISKKVELAIAKLEVQEKIPIVVPFGEN